MRRIEIKHHLWMAVYDAAKYLNEAFFYILVVGISIYFAVNGVITKGDILTYSILFMAVISPLREIHRILDQLRDIGCFYLGFTGGEPFMRNDIMDILWYAKKSGFEVIIYSNGSLIDEKIADELADLRPNKVDITIPGMSKDVFEKISGDDGYASSSQ